MYILFLYLCLFVSRRQFALECMAGIVRRGCLRFGKNRFRWLGAFVIAPAWRTLLDDKMGAVLICHTNAIRSRLAPLVCINCYRGHFSNFLCVSKTEIRDKPLSRSVYDKSFR